MFKKALARGCNKSRIKLQKKNYTNLRSPKLRQDEFFMKIIERHSILCTSEHVACRGGYSVKLNFIFDIFAVLINSLRQ
jgi:hypothetical protein